MCAPVYICPSQIMILVCPYTAHESQNIYLLYQVTQVYLFSFCGMLKHIGHCLTVVTATEVGLTAD